MFVLCFIYETGWDLGPTVRVQSESWGGGWGVDGAWKWVMNSDSKVISQVSRFQCSIQTNKLTWSQNLTSLNILY